MNNTAFPGYPAHKILFVSVLFSVAFHLALFALIPRIPSVSKVKTTTPKKLHVRLAFQTPRIKAIPEVGNARPSVYCPPVPPKERLNTKEHRKPKPKFVKKAAKPHHKKRVKPTPVKTQKPLAKPKPEPASSSAESAITRHETKPATSTGQHLTSTTATSFRASHAVAPSLATLAPKREVAYPDYGKSPALTYPPLARERGIEGKVVLKVLVSKDGRPLKVTLEKSSGHTILDKAAIRAVKTWVFTPGKVNGKPANMRVKVPVVYELK